MSSEIKHHPDDATLVSYAAGTLAEGLTAVVAAHVSMCEHCRAEVADLELLGASLLLTAPAASQRLATPRRQSHLARQAEPQAQASRGGDRLPSPIVQAFGLSFETVPWKRLGPGMWHHRLPLSAGQSGDLRLLRIGPGRRLPDHGHGGEELTLVIEGAYSDVTGIYRRGDLQDVDEGIEHQPIVDMAGECICLIASEQPARFKGLIGRLLQPWTGM